MTSGHFIINQKARLTRAKSDTNLLRHIPELPKQDLKTDSILATSSFRTVVTSIQKPISLLDNGTSVTTGVSEITTNTASIDHKVAVSNQAGQFTADYLIKINKMSNQLVDDAKYSDKERSLAVETMKHILEESTEILYWVLQKKQEKKDETYTVLHHKEDLFQAMYQMTKKCTKYNDLFQTMCQVEEESKKNTDMMALGSDECSVKLCFKPDKLIHVRDVNKLNVGDVKESKDRLQKLRPYIGATTEKMSLQNAIVYIPICTGSNKPLQGEALQEVINAYIALGARQIYVYLGRYDGDPTSAKALEGEGLRQKWIKENQCYIQNKSIVKLITRQEMTKERHYLLCERIAAKMFLDDSDVSNAILSDTKKYVKRKSAQKTAITSLDSACAMLGASTVEAKKQESESRSSYAPVPRRAPSPLLSMNLASSQPVSVSGSPQSPSRVTMFMQGSMPSTPLLKADVKPRSRSAPASLSSSPDSHPAMGSVDSVTALFISELARKALESDHPQARQRAMEMVEKLRKLSPVQFISESEGLVKNPSALISCPTVSTHSQTLFSSGQQILMNGVTLTSTQPNSVTTTPVTATPESNVTPSK